MSIRKRILTSMILLTALCGIAVLISSIVLFNREIDIAIHDRINTAAIVIDNEIKNMKAEAHLAAIAMVNNQGLVEALESGDREKVLRTAQDLLAMTSLDYCTIRDSNGAVIAMTHVPDFFGEELMQMPHIVAAALGGSSVHIVQGVTIPLAISAGAPIFNNDDVLLGIISLGYRFDNQELVYSLKNITGCEVAFFTDDERISSTLLDDDGSYLVGTHADSDISRLVLSGETFTGRSHLFGRDAIVSVFPLFGSDGEVLGMVGTGFYTAEETGKFWVFVVTGVGITLIVLILCVILASYISITIERRMAELATHKELEHIMSSRFEYSRKLADALSEITKSPGISAGDIKAAAEIIAREGCSVLNVSRISIWTLVESGEALTNITCFERSTGEHSVLDDFDLIHRAEYAKLLHTERLLIASNIHEAALLDDGYNPDLCAELEAPVRIDGNFIGLVCADLDISDEFPEKRDWLTEEQNFVSSLADLMALAFSGYERRKAREEAEDANKAKSTFLASMSHEIRTPMNSILGVTDILLQKELLPSDIEDGLSRIYTSSDMLLGIINDILDFSKIEAGKMDILNEEYVTASLINDSVQLNMTRAYDKPIEFEVHIDEKIPARLIGDELRIKQIINNLLSNAFKFTESGTVMFTVVSEPLTDNDVTLILVVRDTGRGMTKEQLNNMFEEYSRFDHEHSISTEGTGLGLAITHRLLSLMNGGISVESEPGVGTVFTVRLPQKLIDSEIVGADVANHLKHFRMNYVSRNRRGRVSHDPMPYGKVLIVDDFEANLYVATGLMKPYELKIDTVLSGLEAIEKISSGEVYDIIFMDQMMPHMTGIEATGRLRSSGYKEPIVALTANAVVGQADMFLQNGFDDFISKPIDIRQLNQVLKKYIRDKQPPEVLEAAHLRREEADKVSNFDGQTPKYPSDSRLLNLKVEGLDIGEGLKRYGNDEDAYLNILRSYMVSVRTTLDVIKVFSDDIADDYQIKVHGIKGASFDVFALQVGNMAQDLEEASKAGDLEFIRANNPDFIDAARKLVDAIDDMFSRLSEENPKPKKDKPEIDVLLRLFKACKEYNLNEADGAIAEIDTYQYESDDGLAEWLRENVDLMNYPTIIDKLSDLYNF